MKPKPGVIMTPVYTFVVVPYTSWNKTNPSLSSKGWWCQISHHYYIVLVEFSITYHCKITFKTSVEWTWNEVLEYFDHNITLNIFEYWSGHQESMDQNPLETPSNSPKIPVWNIFIWREFNRSHCFIHKHLIPCNKISRKIFRFRVRKTMFHL